MKTYTYDELGVEITSILALGSPITIGFFRVAYKGEEGGFDTGVYVNTSEGQKRYTLSHITKDGIAYANIEDMYVWIANQYESNPLVTIIAEITDDVVAEEPVTVVEESVDTPPTTFKYHALDEIIGMLDANARPYAETFADIYIIGIEHKGELYPMHTVATASEADDVVAELGKSLEYHFAPVDVEETQGESEMLDGFRFVPSGGMASIYIGKLNRLYLRGDIKSTLGIDSKKAKVRVLIAYNPLLKAFAIVKPTSKAVTDDMRAAGYFVSKRKDVTCAKLFREFKLDEYEGTTFYADTASLSGNVVIFKR